MIDTEPLRPESARMGSPSGGSRLGASTLQGAEACPAFFGYRYACRLATRREVAAQSQRFYHMLRGSLMHAGAAYAYAAMMQTPPNWMYERTLEEEWQNLAQGNPELIDEVRAATQFFTTYAQQGSWRPLAVEETFQATIKELDPMGSGPEDGVVVDAKIDLIPQTSGGEVIVVDHKSTISKSKAGRLHAQNPLNNRHMFNFSTYLYMRIVQLDMERRMGLAAPRHFVIQRILTVPPYDIARDPLDLSPGVLQTVGAAARLKVRRAQEHLDALNRGEGLVASYSQCFTGSACEFAPLCFAANPLDKEARLRDTYVLEGQPRLSLPVIAG